MWTAQLALAAFAAVSLAVVTTGQLQPFKYDQLPLGQIKARGWLQDQLQLAANGLGGHEYDFYRFAKDTSWTGGTVEYSSLHESSPYWFNYIVPLAFSLDDERLIAQAKNYLDYVLDHQAEDGWLGPETTHESRGLWARSLLLFGLTQYAEADPTETDRIVDSMHRFISLANAMLKDNFTGLIQHGDDNFDGGEFGLARTHELPLSFQWLYDHYPNGNEALLLETMELMFAGGRQGGYDWTNFFVKGVFPEVGWPELPVANLSGFTHGVNLAEGFRYPGILYRLTGNESLIQQSLDGVNMTFTYHGSASGTIIADEHLGGLNPQRGSELCTAAETVFSLHWLYRMFGTNYYADRTELAAFNAFPAAVASDWWSHQYMAQPNQPWARNLTQSPFFDVNSYGNTFSLEPNYPCCTVNHPQTYPKFVAASFVRKGSNGLVHALLSPATVTTTLNNGTNAVTVTSDTFYPFGETLTYAISAAQPFDFYIRVPGWAVLSSSSISINNGTATPLSPDSDSLQHVAAPAGTSSVSITLGMAIDVTTRNATSGAIAVARGPLVYGLDISFNTETHAPLAYNNEQPLPSDTISAQTQDHAYNPTAEWRIAIDPAGLATHDAGLQLGTDTLPNPVWARGAPPVSLSAPACVVEWGNDTGTASVPPARPACAENTTVTATLIPYGAAKLRIAELPVVSLV